MAIAPITPTPPPEAIVQLYPLVTTRFASLPSAITQLTLSRAEAAADHKVHAERTATTMDLYLRDGSSRVSTIKSFSTATRIHMSEGNAQVERVARLKLRELNQKEGFLQELRLVATLSHPHIVPYLTSFVAQQQIWAYAPLYDEELYTWHPRVLRLMEPTEQQRTMQALMAQVLDALQYLHAQGIVHNDIKHRNILIKRVEGGWHVGLIDFGLASRGDPPPFVGALEFMPPEKAVRKGYLTSGYTDLGTSCDIWCLGITFQTIHEGGFSPWSRLMREIFEAERRGDMATAEAGKRRAMELLPSLEQVACPDRNLDPVGSALWHMLRPDPAQRPSAAQLLQQAARWIQQFPHTPFRASGLHN